MVEVIASKLMGGIRGKDKVNGPRKPKERDSKPNGSTWQELQLTGPWEEEEVKMK